MCIFQTSYCKTLLKLPDLPLSNFRVRVVKVEILSSLFRTENAIYRNEAPQLDLGILKVLELALPLKRKKIVPYFGI